MAFPNYVLSLCSEVTLDHFQVICLPFSGNFHGSKTRLDLKNMNNFQGFSVSYNKRFLRNIVKAFERFPSSLAGRWLKDWLSAAEKVKIG